MSTTCSLDDQLGAAMVIGRFALAFLAAMLVAPAALAQNFPSRPMIIVAPLGLGSALDLIARILGSRLAEELGQSVLIENVGGGGMTAAARVARAARRLAPDRRSPAYLKALVETVTKLWEGIIKASGVELQ